MQKSKRTLTPKLRFPEFREAGEWKNNFLGELCGLITKGTTPTSYGYEYVDSGIRFIKIESLADGSIDLSKTMFITVACNQALARSQLQTNDILFSIAGALGIVAMIDGKFLPANTNQALAIVRLKNGINLKFVYFSLNSPCVQLEINRIKAGAAQPNISLRQLGDFDLLTPPPQPSNKRSPTV